MIFFSLQEFAGSPEASLLEKVKIGAFAGLIGGLGLSFVVWRIVISFFEPSANRYKFRAYRK